MKLSEREVRERVESSGQGHVLRFWGELDALGRAQLLGQLARVDFEQVARLGALLGAPPEAPATRFDPPETFSLERDEERLAEARAAAERGAAHLAAGRVAYVLVAGGQASRLGYDGPKGCFPIGPVSGDSLFAIHAARLAAARRRYGTRVPWCIMTSEANDEATRAFFEAHGYFGLDAPDVHFVVQEMLPALDDDGKLMLAAKDSLFLAPNGHGGVLDGLARSGLLARLADDGVETLSYFQVDNPLARPADPLFLGLHMEAGAGMSSKVVAKRGPAEKVGVIGRIDGRMGCIEYSDLPPELREATDRGGRLRFGAGNIAVHAIQRGFVEELTRGGLQLPYHLARKRVLALGDGGALTELWATKFETFVFDALARTEASVVLEVSRALEFSPVKNADGEDSPDTARRDLCRLYSQWIQDLGRELPPADSQGIVPVEVDPRLAEDLAELRASGPPDPIVGPKGHLYRAP